MSESRLIQSNSSSLESHIGIMVFSILWHSK